MNPHLSDAAPRGPPQTAFGLEADPQTLVEAFPANDFDQTPVFDPADPEPVPELDLDPTRGA